MGIIYDGKTGISFYDGEGPAPSNTELVAVTPKYVDDKLNTIGNGGDIDQITQATSRNITSDDNNKSIIAADAVVLTVPTGLVKQPTFYVIPPTSGSITIAGSGGVTINGTVNGSVVRGISNVIVCVFPVADNSYRVTGV